MSLIESTLGVNTHEGTFSDHSAADNQSPHYYNPNDGAFLPATCHRRIPEGYKGPLGRNSTNSQPQAINQTPLCVQDRLDGAHDFSPMAPSAAGTNGSDFPAPYYIAPSRRAPAFAQPIHSIQPLYTCENHREVSEVLNNSDVHPREGGLSNSPEQFTNSIPASQAGCDQRKPLNIQLCKRQVETPSSATKNISPAKPIIPVYANFPSAIPESTSANTPPNVDTAPHLIHIANTGNILPPQERHIARLNEETTTEVDEVVEEGSKLTAEGLTIPGFDVDDSRELSLEWDFKLKEDSEGKVEPDGPYDSASEELLQTLSGILQNTEQRESLCRMQGRNAQVMIEYLYTVLSKPELPERWFRRHCLIALYKLCKVSKLYPQCYILNDSSIVTDSYEALGGFSDIYKGTFEEKDICLKVVRLNKSDINLMLKRYAKEAILWGQLNHPNIVPFYGIYYRDQMRNQLCLVSPWMSHGHIVQYLQRNPLVSRPLLAYDVVAGLYYLHDSHLVHSDLKGANILVNSLGQACITDFGMSFVYTNKTLARSLATSTRHGFTQRWASPELLETDARPSMESDIWALGCVFYEILTGEIPFNHLKSDAQVIQALINKEVPRRPKSSKSSSRSNPEEAVIWKQAERCWTRKPCKRPKCKDILLELKSTGITRESSPRQQCETDKEVRRLRNAMRMDSEDHADVHEVQRILNGLSSSTITAPAAPPVAGHPSSAYRNPPQPPLDIFFALKPFFDHFRPPVQQLQVRKKNDFKRLLRITLVRVLGGCKR